MIVYIDPNCEKDYLDVKSLDEFKQAAKTDKSIHFYELDGFVEAFNNGHISDEGYIINAE